MIRLHVVAEGQTEETFVNRVLAPHLGAFGISTDVHCVTTSRHRGRPLRGGIGSYAQLKRDLVLWTRQDQKHDARFTTLIDLYALPSDFPSHAAASRKTDPYEKVEFLEDALAEDVGDRRVVAHFQLHEFEALLLVAPEQLSTELIGYDAAIARLVALCKTFRSPELIDDDVRTAPSKRIIAEIPEYAARKSSVGPLVAERIGLETIRRSCPHFDRWLRRLERLDSMG